MRLIDPIELKRAISVVAMSNNHKTLEQIIDEQPTIEEHSIGTWEPKEAQNVPYGIILECSCCGWETLVNDALYFKYCPNCGSKMVI